MGIGLVTDIPHKLVVGGVEHIVERHSELYGPEARRQVAGVRREGVYDVVAQLVNNRCQLVDGYAFEVCR